MTWTLTYIGERAWTLNRERRASRHERAAMARQWRTAFAWRAKAQRVPPLVAVEITATPLLASMRWMQDTAGAFSSVKSSIDGLVDAAVLADDGPTVVRAITFRAPRVGDLDGLAVVVEAVG